MAKRTLPFRFFPKTPHVLTSLLLCLIPGLASAFDAILEGIAPDTPLYQRVTGASLVFQAKAEEITDGQDIVAAAQADYKRLISVLYEAGYFGPSVSINLDGREAADISPFATITSVKRIVLDVDTGPQFQFGDAVVAPVAPETELPDGFASGKTASVSVIQDAAVAAVDGWRAKGHAKADVAGQTITADHRSAELDAKVDIEPGPELTFGRLIYTGESQVRDERVVAIADLPSGERFDPEEARRVATRLRRTGTFRAVDLREADEPNPDGSLDMNLTVVDDKRRRIGFGAELESRDGLSLSAFWLHRNLFGGAENFRIDASVDNLGAQSGGTDYRIGTTYTRPATLRSDTELAIAFEIKQEDEPLYFLRQVGTVIGFRRVYSKRVEAELGLGVFISEVEDNFGVRDFAIYGLPFRFKYDARDDIVDPTRGYYVGATAFPYLGYADAKNALFLKGDFRTYRGFGLDNRVIAAARVQVGSIIGPDIPETPPDLLFFSGGGGSVRGQPYQSNFVSVGGIDSGGLSFLGLSGELRVKVTQQISAVAFYDAGFVGETADFTGAGNWHAGAGLGARYHTGFGPLRLDLGFPVSGDTSGGPQLYIGIGHAF
ncbi:autotransporter secretion outer membrane protein TamA [Shimia isoporae]|uniref:Autotransporter secretion outer membrane protein TamA n=1 Tax=Shimia isoporae TaxID=647720 RepID=A0A4R1N8J8_9RHOB|nr:BamA/TamA family outer membrane protein [Shimia isoporae]TCL01424.1 autotransporter secretion outer membrane protein TamA [Shimia isoporae]